jgi:hypothetical protein
VKPSRLTPLLWLGAVAAVVWLSAGPAVSQDPTLAPEYGEIRLRAGFKPDPQTFQLEAGGNVQTTKGGVKAYVGRAPDYRINYTAGEFKLTFKVECKGDTTLLINTPDGKWIANDDTDGLNPRITFGDPRSGQYDVWVGTVGPELLKATLVVTELKQPN